MVLPPQNLLIFLKSFYPRRCALRSSSTKRRKNPIMISSLLLEIKQNRKPFPFFSSNRLNKICSGEDKVKHRWCRSSHLKENICYIQGLRMELKYWRSADYGACGLCDRLNDGGAFLYLLLLLFFYPFHLFPPLLHIPVSSSPSSSFVIRLLLFSKWWWFTGLTHHGSTWQSRWTTRLVTTHFFLSLLSSSSGTRCKRGRLILNLLPFNKVRVRFDPFSGGQRDLQIVREIRNELHVLSLFPFYYNYHYSFN